ncbi:GNAT family N-acetyltransferase [Pueribacillus theae]|uniref:GNAT family N-acetyltransferase n=2 Tax=Pueribacillus theae TaxID=2171751 RepID=A0A2U1JWD1_9BACI|nr:GNAT family N-acetyltransferase [Pueribacillus theae]
MNAMKLVWSVFLEFEAPDYTAEGINTFRDFINNEDAIKGLEIYGAYEKGNLIGVIATRNEGNHIALFFVHGKYHKQGVGRKLFEAVLKNSTLEIITVNSSPYAVEIYHKLGFVDTDIEQIKEGMRFTPMKYQKYE